jgi:D-alanine-D-alanine ligase-like ATP-grasp enzyme
MMDLLDHMARLGHPGRALSAKFDLLRFAGLGYYVRRTCDQPSFAKLGKRARDAFYEQMWREAAAAVGARAVALGPGRLELTRDAKSTRVDRQTVGIDPQQVLDVAIDKAGAHRLLADAGVTVPKYVEFRFEDQAPAQAFLKSAGGPCVVKPAAGTAGGHGVTAGVVHPADLRRACTYAAQETDRLLIEQQAPGAVYRLLLLEGELLDVVRSTPEQLTGDGRTPIAGLMRAENRRRVAASGAAGLGVLGVDLDLALTLESAGLSLSSVPAAEQSVAIRSITNGTGVRQCRSYTGPLADSLLEQVQAAVSAVGLRLAGVDVITPDPTRPLHEVGGVVNEVNGRPGLHHHYLVADPEQATRVAIPILERLLR